jgi:hypothetical protein
MPDSLPTVTVVSTNGINQILEELDAIPEEMKDG